jgi:hypothetical protein
MDKSSWVKIVWLVAIFLAIPAAILAVQKPAAPRVGVETHRVVVVEQPVSVDINDRQIEGAKPADSAGAPPVDPPTPRAMHLGAEKITMKGGAAAPDPALGKTDTGSKEQSLTSVLAPVAGPQAAKTAAP